MASNEPLSIDELLEGLSDDRSNSGNRRSNSDDSVYSSTSGRSESSFGREQTEESGRDSVQLSKDGPVERGSLQIGLEGRKLSGNDTAVDNRSTDASSSVQSVSDLVGDPEDGPEDGEDTNGLEPDKEKGKQELPDLPKGITEEIVDRVVSSAWLSHMLDGSVNVDNIKENLPKNVALPKGWTVGKVLLLPHVAKKLEARGVPKPSEANILTPKQIQALTVITSARGSKWQTRLKQAGVTIAEWNSWLKQPNFRMVFDRYAEGRLKDAIPEGITALTDKAADGDLNSIKLVLEMTGRHNPNAEKDINIQAILVGIVEILQQEIHDGEALMRIVNRIKGLQTGIGIGSGHIKGEIE